MKIRKGYIPSEVVYHYEWPTTVYQRWDDVEQSPKEIKSYGVIPAQCFARAKEPLGLLDLDSNGIIIRKDNKPFSGLRLLVQSFNAVSATTEFKVATPDNFLFSISFDVLLDAIQADGIPSSGILNGEYIWACVESKMKLVRVGSTLHTALLEASAREMVNPLPSKLLKVGTIYETKKGQTALFLGFVDYWDYDLKWPNFKSYITNINKYNKDRRRGHKPDTPTVVRKFAKKHFLWLTVDDSVDNPNSFIAMQYFLDILSVTDRYLQFSYPYDLHLKKNHDMARKIARDFTIPTDIVERIRMKMLMHFQVLQSPPFQMSNPKFDHFAREHDAAKMMKLVTMRLSGAPEPVVTDAYLLYIQGMLDQTLPDPNLPKPSLPQPVNSLKSL